MNFKFSVFFSRKSSTVLVRRVCSFPSSVCFRLRRLGLISSFHPLQFWWGPKCLLSYTAKGNPHKPQKAVKKLRANRSGSLLSQAASSPCVGLPCHGCQWQLCKEKGNPSGGFAPSLWLKGHPHARHLFCICSMFKGAYCWGFQGRVSSLQRFCNLQIRGDETNVVWRIGHGTGSCSLRLASYLPLCSTSRGTCMFLNYHLF